MKSRLLIGAPIAALSLVLLSGCGVANIVAPPFAAAIYATPADAVGAPANLAVPPWVPADAQNIRIKTDETKNASILTFTATATPPTFTGCDAASDPEVDPTTTAALDETWWPQVDINTAGVVCSGKWHIFGQDNAYYAWTP